MTINYDYQIWHTNDNSLWVTTEEPYWIPIILDDGVSIFVFTNVGYYHRYNEVKYNFVNRSVYHTIFDQVKYNFVCDKIEDWHQA
jgi:hypothetical protein